MLRAFLENKGIFSLAWSVSEWSAPARRVYSEWIVRTIIRITGHAVIEP